MAVAQAPRATLDLRLSQCPTAHLDVRACPPGILNLLPGASGGTHVRPEGEALVVSAKANGMSGDGFPSYLHGTACVTSDITGAVRFPPVVRTSQAVAEV